MTKISYNVLSFIFSYLDLEQISIITEEMKDSDKKLLLENLSVSRKIKFKVINAIINNYQRRCGECYSTLNNDWVLILSKTECDNCLSFNRNIEICNKCYKNKTGSYINRGELNSYFCKNCDRIILYLGINVLS